jgi:hypothetical protein
VAVRVEYLNFVVLSVHNGIGLFASIAAVSPRRLPLVSHNPGPERNRSA